MKKILLIPCLLTLIFTITQRATANVIITNRSATESARVVYAYWKDADNTFPAGWRTKGWSEIAPGAIRELFVPKANKWVYIRVERGGNEVKPPDHAGSDADLFWMHPSQSFIAVQTDQGKLLKSNRAQGNLKKLRLYKFPNGGSQTIPKVLKQDRSLALRVFKKYSKTLQRKDIQAVLPSAFQSLKAPKTQRLLSPATINLVVSNPNLLKQFVPNIDPKFIRLLKRNAKLKSMLRDPLMQRLLQKPAAIDALAKLLDIDAPVRGVIPQRNAKAPPAWSKQVLKQTQLLSNYPNPFNPETWIPYQLAEDSNVAIIISDMRGITIRRLAIGHQPAGIYEGKSRAAYWDGKNALGEPVASGVYFYTLTAGDFTATRKMLIRK